jgi:hypothetical protein
METVKSIQMEVIPEPQPGTASVLVYAHKGKHVIIRSTSDHNYLCGSCQNVICERVALGQISNLVFKCPNCGAFNRVRGTGAV